MNMRIGFKRISFRHAMALALPAAMLFCLQTPGQAQPPQARGGTTRAPARIRFEWPDTPAGKCAALYFEAYNSGEDDQMRSFWKKNSNRAKYSKKGLEEYIEMYHKDRADARTLTPVFVAGSTDLEIAVFLRDGEAQHGWIYEFRLREQSPHQISSISVSGPFAPDLSEDEVRARVARSVILDAAKRGAIIEKVLELLNDKYVFPDKAKEMDALLRRKQRNGDYGEIDSLSAFTMRLTRDLQSVSQDLHLKVVVGMKKEWLGRDELTPEDRARQLADRRYENFGFRRVERLPGNIGYLEIVRFSDAKDGGMTAVAAMNFLAFCDALIIDLRRNGGGTPHMVQLITSYLFDEPRHLNSIYDAKDDFTHQYWSQAHVQGPRMADVPVYVLTSGRTASGAEEFSYNLKNLERATLVGETTAGGAHLTEPVPVPELGITVMVPFGRAVNPISHDNWEGKGVVPHIKVDAAEAFEVARAEAIKTLLEKQGDPEKKRVLQFELEGLEAAEGEGALAKDAAALEEYAGNYDRARIWIEGGVLYTQPPGSSKCRLVPLRKDLFNLENREERVQFSRDEAGRISALFVVFPDGRRIQCDRVGS